MALDFALASFSLALLLLAGCGTGERAGPARSARSSGDGAPVTRIRVPVDAKTGAEASIALWATAGHSAPVANRLVLAAWPDGRVIAGGDTLLGGAPYVRGVVDLELVERARRQIEAATADPSVRSFAVPDSSCRHLFVAVEGPDRSLDSAIELFERGPDLVATDHGIEPLEGRNREAVIARQSAGHRAMRSAWSQCVEILGELAQHARTHDDDPEPVRYVWRAP
jgi:hypothetical protein